jgi:PKD repeat protein
MKKTIFTLLVTFTFFSLFAQVDRERVLVEIGTGGWCTYCPGAAMGADDLHENGDPVAIIEYHNGDPYATNESNARNSYYNISGYPTAWFDGSYNSVVGGSHTQSMYGSYLPIVNARIQIPTSFVLEISGSNSGDEYSINVNVQKVGDYTGSNLKVRFAVTESNIQYNWQGQTELNFVCRDMVPDQNGTLVDFSDTDEVDVPLTFTFNNSWDIEECELIAFIQDDNSKEVLHSTNLMLTDLGGGSPDFSAGFFADITDFCEAPAVAHFHSACVGNPTSWNWTFEGGIPATSTNKNPSVTYPNEGSYDVQLIVSDGTHTDELIVTKYINVSGLPDVSWTSVPDLCNEDWDPYLLTEGQPEGGVYSGDHIIDNMYFDAEGLEPNDYLVTYTFENEYGCSNSADYMVSVVNCVGVDENKTVGLELYPNPTNGILNLNISADQFNNASLSIIDAVGKEIYHQDGLNIDGSYSTSVDLSEQPQGIYFVILKSDNQRASKKIFLNK